MGLVKFRHKDGAICEAEFPLADLVEFQLEDGQKHFKGKVHFLCEWTQVVPELPPTDATNVPELAVVTTPGTPLASPAPAAAPQALREDVVELYRRLSSELGQVASNVVKIGAICEGILEQLVKLAPPAPAPPPEPAELELVEPPKAEPS